MPSYLVTMPRLSPLLAVSQRPSRRWLGLTLLVTLVVILVAYVVETNALSIKGYEIKALERQLQGLEQGYEELQLESAKLGALSESESVVLGQQFVAVERVEYLGPGPAASGVAVRP